jgi:hypothetical protein
LRTDNKEDFWKSQDNILAPRNPKSTKNKKRVRAIQGNHLHNQDHQDHHDHQDQGKQQDHSDHLHYLDHQDLVSSRDTMFVVFNFTSKYAALMAFVFSFLQDSSDGLPDGFSSDGLPDGFSSDDGKCLCLRRENNK